MLIACFKRAGDFLHCFKGIFHKAYVHDLTGMHGLTGNLAYYDFFRKTHVPLYIIFHFLSIPVRVVVAWWEPILSGCSLFSWGGWHGEWEMLSGVSSQLVGLKGVQVWPQTQFFQYRLPSKQLNCPVVFLSWLQSFFQLHVCFAKRNVRKSVCNHTWMELAVGQVSVVHMTGYVRGGIGRLRQ